MTVRSVTTSRCMKFFYCLVFFSLVSLLNACASSNVTRTAESNVELGRVNAAKMAYGATSQDLAGSYQNMSQRNKGALIGTVAGGAAGSIIGSSVGILPGALTGGILGASYGAYIDSETTLRDRLENSGAIIMELGDRIVIMIPSVRLFEEHSAHLKASAYTTLDLTARYINRFTKMLVKISVYTNDDTKESINLPLSQKQANAVAEVLQRSGVDARILYAIGYGNKHFVERTCLSWSESLNYRVEISLQRLFV